MTELTLPEPARALWLAKRHIIHSLPPEEPGRIIRPHLAGGTTLAARLKHRKSVDIDIVLPGRNSLIDLVQADERDLANRLGGTPKAITDKRVKVSFPTGEIDVSVLQPEPSPSRHGRPESGNAL